MFPFFARVSRDVQAHRPGDLEQGLDAIQETFFAPPKDERESEIDRRDALSPISRPGGIWGRMLRMAQWRAGGDVAVW
jgi:hypothetical protein